MYNDHQDTYPVIKQTRGFEILMWIRADLDR